MILFKAKWAWLILLLYVHVFSSMKIQECMLMYNANFGEDIKKRKHFSLHTPPQKKNNNHIVPIHVFRFDIFNFETKDNPLERQTYAAELYIYIFYI